MLSTNSGGLVFQHNYARNDYPDVIYLSYPFSQIVVVFEETKKDQNSNKSLLVRFRTCIKCKIIFDDSTRPH